MFTLIRSHAEVAGQPAEAARACGSLGLDTETFLFALAVFEELGLFRWKGETQVFRGKRTELAASSVYTAVVRL